MCCGCLASVRAAHLIARAVRSPGYDYLIAMFAAGLLAALGALIVKIVNRLLAGNPRGAA